MYENRRYIILNTSETGSINFNEVLQSNTGSLRLSVDKTKTFVKYDITEVTESFETYFINDDNTWITQSNAVGIYGRPTIYNNQAEYTHTDFLNVLTGSMWNRDMGY